VFAGFAARFGSFKRHFQAVRVLLFPHSERLGMRITMTLRVIIVVVVKVYFSDSPSHFTCDVALRNGVGAFSMLL